MKQLVICMILGLVPMADAWAMEGRIPGNMEIMAVQDFYLDGDVPVPLLVDLQLCAEVPVRGDNKYKCEKTLEENLVRPGQEFYVWMNYMVPEGQGSKILVQLNQEGVTHHARTLQLKPSLRYRTWAKMKLPSSGDWQIPVYLRAANEMREITRLKLSVM